MNELQFLEVDEVIAINEEQTTRFGGLCGIRDFGALESAVSAAEFYACYEDQDLFNLAAVLMTHLIQNHAFLDGNKRTGLKSALVFLRINGVSITKSNLDPLEDLAVSIAKKEVGKEMAAQILRELFS
jgi:death on curing protein